MSCRYERTGRALAALCFSLLTCSVLVVLQVPPANGYELSIYDTLPPLFWACLIITIISGFAVIICSVLSREGSSTIWIIGFLGVMLAYALFLSLPVFRGYYLGWGSGEDAISHIGEMKAILFTGHTGSENFYPMVHVLGSALNFSTSTPVKTIATILPSLFLAFYLSSICLLGMSINGRDGQRGLILVAFAVPLLFSPFHRRIHPSFLSLYAVPLLLYLSLKREIIRSHKSRVALLVLLTAFFITFCHPITALVVIIAFGILAISGHCLKSSFAWSRGQGKLPRQIESPSTNMILFLLTAFGSWYFSYSSFQGNLRRVIDWLIYQETATLAQTYYEYMTTVDLTFVQGASILINQYGAILLYLILSFVSSFLVVRGLLKRKRQEHSVEFQYTLLFLATVLISLLFWFGYFIERNPIRVLRFPLFFSVILNGLVFGRLTGSTSKGKSLIKGVRKKYFLVLLITFMVSLSVVLSIFNTYGSSRTLRGNEEVTHMEATGMEWFLLHGNHMVTTTSNIKIHRFEDLFICYKRSPCERMPTDPDMIPSHFGYAGNSSIAAVFGFEDRYLITTEFDRVSMKIFPPELRSEKLHKYLDEDFALLLRDQTLHRLYSSGELNVWRTFSE